MNLQILVSKKGTRVVTASNLHKSLGLPDRQYMANVAKWLQDVFEFKDGIRKPEAMRDYARRKIKDAPVINDYYLSIELAKLITLNSNSKEKMKYARWLFSLEEKVANGDLISKDQVVAVLELTKAMGLVSCQESAEREHLKTYKSRNGGLPSNWWKYRTNILGYSLKDFKRKLELKGKTAKGKNGRQILFNTDKYEMIRTGIIDLFMAMGKSEGYARNLGDLAKTLAKELNLEIVDDRKGGSLFEGQANPTTAEEIRHYQYGERLSSWAE